MKNAFIHKVVMVAIAGVSLTYSGGAEANPQGDAKKTLCSGAEKVIFSCSTGKKTVSVCQTDNYGSVQYRFGKPGATPDIALPEDPTTHQGVMKGKVMLIGGGGSYITFTKGDIQYTVHDYTTKQGDDTGVSVHRPGKTAISIQCTELPDGDLVDGIPASVPLDPESMLQ